MQAGQQAYPYLNQHLNQDYVDRSKVYQTPWIYPSILTAVRGSPKALMTTSNCGNPHRSSNRALYSYPTIYDYIPVPSSQPPSPEGNDDMKRKIIKTDPWSPYN